MIVDETIAAISTPLGEGGIGIVRISGKEAFSIGQKIFSPRKKKAGGDYPRSHHLYFGDLLSREGETIDEVLVSFMKGPHTYTCEDTVEINCHSGIFTLRLILQRVLEAGARAARPGEFTRWALLNGRIDLSQAESVLNIIRARSDEAVRTSAANMQGYFSREIGRMRQELLGLLAWIEAQLDFPEDLEADSAREGQLQDELGRMIGLLEQISRGAQRGMVMQEGLASAIVGKPNAGKSSLLNALLGEQRAIVHELPGTTRDLLEGYLTVRGYPLRLIDTAGIHGTADPVEQAGIEKAREAVAGAGLLIVVLDGSTAWDDDDEAVVSLMREGQPAVIVINKSDLPQQLSSAEMGMRFSGRPLVLTAAIKNKGIEQLEKSIERLLDRDLGTAPQESPVVVNLRHAEIVDRARNHLETARQALTELPLELAAIDLREAWWILGEITGETAPAELLDRIFQDFCIGK
ncbi:MAG: tRNA uridine-5-carboxymethylaminomethyl(34) synthesis GTPase MnmE [Firmicutes bacterium]|nr:tRNA uridine-5-carboxymethylaminomethyl(34) synthesis GTPase MnmE [Bacillota bacterium]